MQDGEERGGGGLAGLTPRRVAAVAALFIVAYFGVTITSNMATHLRLAREKATLEEEVYALRVREAQLTALREYMQSDAFVESVARDNGLVRPGEIAVVSIGPGGDGRRLAGRPGDPWWLRYFEDPDRP